MGAQNKDSGKKTKVLGPDDRKDEEKPGLVSVGQDPNDMDREEVSSIFELSDSQIVEIGDDQEGHGFDLSVWAALRESYIAEASAQTKGDVRRGARFLYEIGRLDEEVFRDASSALGQYKKASSVGLVLVTEALRRRYVLMGAWGDVVSTIEAEIKATDDEASRAALWEWAGRVYADQRADVKRAGLAFSKALKLDGAYQPTNFSLVELHSKGYDHKAKVKALLQAASVTADPDFKAALIGEAGFVTLDRLKNQDQATELFLQAVKANPHNEGARMTLERLLHQQQRWGDLIDVLVQEADLCGDMELNFANRFLAGWLAWTKLQNVDRSAELLEQAAALRRDVQLPLWELVALYEQAGKWEALASVLDRLVEQVEASGAARDVATLYYKVGAIRQGRLGDAAGAIEAYRKALNVWPGDFPARRALAKHYHHEQDWSALVTLLEVEVQVLEDPRQRAAIALELADLMEYRLGESDRAIHLYLLAHALEQGRGRAFRSLDRMFTVREEWDRLAEVLRAEIQACSDTARTIALTKRLAAILAERLDRPEEAINLLSGLTDLLSSVQPKVLAHREALMDLARLDERLGRWRDLVDVLVGQVDLTKDVEEKCSLLCQAAAVADENLEDEDFAKGLYRRVLEVNTGYLDALSGLGRILHRQGRWEELVEVYQLQRKTCRASQDTADVLYRMGQILETKLADVNGAIRNYRQAIEVEPHHVPAQDALGDLLVRSERWEDYIEFLDQLGDATDPSRHAVSSLRATLILADRLSRPEGAAKRFESVLSVPAVADVALLAWERVLAQRGDWEGMAEVLEKQLETGAWDAVRTGLRLSVLSRHFLPNKGRALKDLSEVLALEPTNREALLSEVELLRKGSPADRLAASVINLADAMSDRATAVALLKQKIAWVGQDGSEAGGEAAVSRRILDSMPSDREAMETLDRLAVEAGNDEALVDVCRMEIAHVKRGSEDGGAAYVRLGDILWRLGRLEEAAMAFERARAVHVDDLPAVRSLRMVRQLQGKQQEVAELLAEESRLCRDQQAAMDALMRAGDIWLIEFVDPSKAEAAYQKVFETKPGHDVAFGRLASLLSSRDAYQELADLYRKRIVHITEADRPDLMIDLASVLQEHLADNTGAISVLEEVLALRPDDKKALDALAVLYPGVRKWREAGRVMERLAEISRSDAEVVGYLLQLAQIENDHLHEAQKAIEVTEKVLERDPDNRQAREMLVNLALKLGQWEQAAAGLAQLAESSVPAQRAAWLIKLADVTSRGLAKPDDAQEYLVRAAALCLLAPEAIEELDRFFEERNDPAGYDLLLGRVLEEATPDRPGGTALRLARARNLARRLLKPELAEKEVQRALGEDPESVEARLEIAALHLWADRDGMALAEYKGVLKRDPLRYEAYRGLFQVFDKREEVDRAHCAAQVLCVFDHATEAEEAAAEKAALAMESAAVMPSCLSTDVIVDLMAPEAEPITARNLLFAVAPYLHGMFPRSLAGRELGDMEEIRPDHQWYELASNAAVRLGLDRFEILVDRSLGTRSVVIPGNTPALVFGEGLMGVADSRMFGFCVGRAWAQVVTGSAFLEWADLHELELVLAGIVSQFDRSFGQDLASRNDLAERGKAFMKQVPRKVRKSIEEPALVYAQASAVGMTTWQEAARTTANRVGLCVCGDLRAAAAVLRAEKTDEDILTGLLLYNIGSRLVRAREACAVVVER